MQIVILDGHTANPGDLDYAALEALGELTVYERSEADEVPQRAAGAEAVLTNKTPLSAATLEQLPKLRYVGVLATGVNVVDLEAARARGIPVTNVPGYSTKSVAQHAFAMVLELTNHLSDHHRAVRDGQWVACPDFSFTLRPIHELDGKTLGIVGLGSIGQQMARIGHIFGMQVVAAKQRSMNEIRLHGPQIQWLDHDEVFAAADVLSLHCPLTEATRHLVNRDRLAKMKPNAILINTGRGPLIDERALADALTSGQIAGAGLDVLSSEPPEPDNPVLSAPRCIVTPHLAWASVEARRRLIHIAAENLAAFQRGEASNVVN